jgi:hypothetical protein
MYAMQVHKPYYSDLLLDFVAMNVLRDACYSIIKNHLDLGIYTCIVLLSANALYTLYRMQCF